MLKAVFVVILSYLLGSIPWALVIGKVFYQTDIREKGSGNLGGSNAGRVLGKKAGITVILLDAFKALMAMCLAQWIDPSVLPYAGLACCFGHCFPIFAHFKGGKAVATSFGFLLGISLFHQGEFFGLLIVPVFSFLLILYLFKYVSLASLCALGIAVIISFILKEPHSIKVSLLTLWIFVTYRHRENILRLYKGNERKITWM